MSELFLAKERTKPSPRAQPLWETMNTRQRLAARSASRSSFPDKPGVYAWYRDGTPVYVGKATSLRVRVGGAHLSESENLTKSAFRRNVAEHLGLGSGADIKAGRVLLEGSAVNRVNNWIRQWDVAWVECEDSEAAANLERELKREWCPTLTRR